MLMPDINLLVYAHRADQPYHVAYRDWWTAAVRGPAPVALSQLVALGFVRVVTLAAFPGGATPLSTALAFIDGIVAQPNCRLVAPGAETWRRTAELCRAVNASGKLVADATHAAIAIAEGCTWASRDGDFARFAPHGLRWQHVVL